MARARYVRHTAVDGPWAESRAAIIVDDGLRVSSQMLVGVGEMEYTETARPQTHTHTQQLFGLIHSA